MPETSDETKMSGDSASTVASDSGPSIDIPVGADCGEKQPDTTKSEIAQNKENEAREDTKSEKPTVSPENIKLSRKLKRALDILEEEIEDFVDDHDAEYPPNVERQIELIRKIGKSINPNDEKVAGDDDEWVHAVEKLTMDDWQKEWTKRDPNDAPVPCVQAYYRTIPAAVEDSEVLNGGEASTEVPQRIVITSTILRSELEDIFEVKFAASNSPIVMASPFKFLVTYFPLITERLGQLRHQLSNMDNTLVKPESEHSSRKTNVGQKDTISRDAAGTSDSHGLKPAELNNGKTSRSNSTSDTPDHSIGAIPVPKMPKRNGYAMRRKEMRHRISYLQLLRDFVETDLAYYFDLQAKVLNTSLESIAFEHLWYLFRPGDILFAKEHSYEQLYKIYAVTGGQPRRRNHTKSEIEIMSSEIRGRARHTKYPYSHRYSRLGDSEDDASDDERNKQTVVEASGIGTWTSLTVDCFYMGFDGMDVGPVDCCKKIKHYVGQCKITDLPVYPVRFHKRSSEVLKRMEERGRKLIMSYGHKTYKGLTIPSSRLRYQENLRGEIFVDFQNYYRRYSRRKPKLGMLRKSSPDMTEVAEVVSNNEARRVLVDHEVDEKITNNFMASHHAFIEPASSDLVYDSTDYLQLFPYRVPAYVFRSRSYVQVHIDGLAEIDKTDEARDKGFEDLVIPDSHRNLLVALVQNHETGNAAKFGLDGPDTAYSQIEIVRGKGRGLIILLHGPPGSGKTSTAETIAAYTRRPLYSITCGDLGTGPRDVEESLQEHTERAHRWGCVLLLDEADVFLTRRDWRDMSRNALVSVFLRQLEYYSGILFLTTNRVGVIDEAFKSRIHVSLSYPRIKLRETLQIWRNALDRIDRDNKTSATPIRYDRHALLTFAEKHYRKHEPERTTWNGRQIRNAFQTAIALGQYERQKILEDAEPTAEAGNKPSVSVKLTVANFRVIAKTAREFEDYITNVRGPDSDIARENQLRDDDHTYDEAPRKKDYGRTKAKRESSGYLTPSPSRGLSKRSHGDSSRSKKPATDADDDASGDDDIFEDNLSD